MYGRIAGHPVHEQFLTRWSTRAFSPESIAPETLLTILEAARWAPSSFNAQPWRFVTARRGDEAWPLFLRLINEGNRQWAQRAAALVVLLSARTTLPAGGSKDMLSRTHSFDAGCAWGFLALQASLLGWSTRGIDGFDREETGRTLAVPPAFAVEAIIALGKPGDAAVLPDHWASRERSSPRLPLSRLTYAGKFGNKPSPPNP